jgi:tetratricopeptide (TPR) repeat protein
MLRVRRLLLLLIGTLVLASTARATDDSAAGPTVFLTVREPEAPGPAGGIAPMAMREVVRQAFLVAARDELGLSTRDVMLREDFPEKPDAQSAPFELFCRTLDARDDSKIEYVLTRQGSPKNVLWRLTFAAENPQPLGPLANKAEALSRGDLKDVLVKAGFKGSVPRFRATCDVPSETYDLLFSWNEISVMAGLRRLHAEIREKGESPELLAALAVGYANLGSLTEYYYCGSRKVFYARALLYGERLLYRTHESAWALSNSAYVAMLVGTHNVGADTIAVAKKTALAEKTTGTASPARPLPFFANVIDAFGEGDLKRMLKNAKTPAERRLACYLNWQATLLGPLSDLTLKSLQDFLKECPECPRAYDTLAASDELGPSRYGAEAGIGVTSRFLRKRLPDVPGLPENLAKRVRNSQIARDVAIEIDFRREIVADLKKAGAPEVDRGEPSLSAIGHTLEEIDFAQVIRRLELYYHTLGLPVDQLLETLSPLCAAHPYAVYLNAFTKNKQAMEPAAAELMKKVELFAVTIKERVMLRWLSSIVPGERGRAWLEVPGMHCDMIFIDQMRCIDAGLYGPPDEPKYNAPSMRRCWEVSNKLPLAVSERIIRDWQHAQTEVDKYERDYTDDALVMSALANRYYALKRYDDAERCAKRFVEIHQSYSAYRLLARVYKAKQDPAKWKATLDKAIELPPVGLEQASIQNQIALDLLDRKEFKEAAQYADAAAESYSAWSMITASRCHEMLGEWKKSEQLIRAVSERYEDRSFAWLVWCHRTGKGDTAAADTFVREQIERLGTNLYPGQYRAIGHYYLFIGEPEKALALFKQSFNKDQGFYAGIHAVLTADSLGQATERDALLEAIIKSKVPSTAPGSYGAPIYQPLAVEFKKILALKKFGPADLAAIQKLEPVAAKQYTPSILGYPVGVFLRNRGDLESAKKYLIGSAQSKDWETIDHALACQLLREMKVTVPPVQQDKKPESAESKAKGS